MTTFNKSGMHYTDYKWSAYPSDDPRITGKPDSTLFNRNEGYEVLYLINKMVTTKAEGEKMEKMIRKYLPSDVRSQENVQEWIKANWNKY
jgi:hypothetical protein